MLYGTILAIGMVLVIEFFKLHWKTIGALILTAIAFIYIGFVTWVYPEVIFEGIHAVVFLAVAYYGLTYNKNLIWIGFFAHGLGAAGRLLFPEAHLVPLDFTLVCTTVDWLLAIYFYMKSKK